MKILKNIITNTFCTFSVLSVLFGVLCGVGILENLPYLQVVFPLFFMSVATTLFVTFREVVFPDAGKLKYMIDVLGCSAGILLIGHFVGWLEVSIPYFLLICAMVLVVYFMVWLITWLQSKHDEKDLNRLLSKPVEKR